MDTSSPWEYGGYSDPFDFDPTFSHLDLVHQLSWADENPATAISTNFNYQLECRSRKNKLVDMGEIAESPPIQDSLGATSSGSPPCKLTGELNNQALAVKVDFPEFDEMFRGFDIAPFSSSQQIIENAKEHTGAPKVLLTSTEEASVSIIDPSQLKLQRRKFTKNAKTPLPFPCTACTSSFKNREANTSSFIRIAVSYAMQMAAPNIFKRKKT
ncbi:hypothetical protein H072_11603 [Dactylellina haptotyla CBS 200.50]|uniref:Uncharacterized protein n=1 Tax=Dactylellina haptotyla (strain CBS 200.50) TaxID=1284197 RepID=S8BIU7_DACHA|nr:hypothetical protein H072_11603 [Dactylellina haptotyla CBS 200.50]